ncbi:potassium channel family protein [Larsenimonas salina]|uniref:potassium channel family protein n=1 Tax=Larsenimonas salina TaxID=1295565 RepID=UPI0020746A06|nr:TrkA family potassium uptake protein [Larsenimonas salina]MCM5703526.1 TrkA family potassium uptake protein [Larsenimonas salina]
MSRQFAIIGLGYFGSTVALELHRQNHEVLGVDRDEKRVNKIAEHITRAVIADPTDETALGELNLSEFSAVLVDVDDSIEASVMTTLHLKELKVKELWVKALNDDHHKLLSYIGADRIVHPEYDLGIRVAESLSYHAVVNFIRLGDQQYVVEVELTERLVKRCKTIGELGFSDKQATVVAIKQGAQLDCTPSTSTALQAGDHLVLIGDLDVLRHFGDKL